MLRFGRLSSKLAGTVSDAVASLACRSQPQAVTIARASTSLASALCSIPAVLVCRSTLLAGVVGIFFRPLELVILSSTCAGRLVIVLVANNKRAAMHL